VLGDSAADTVWTGVSDTRADSVSVGATE
jgi:hypothetical protein